MWLHDDHANVKFADHGNDSSLINTEVADTTISTSSRLGNRWLNGDLCWMYVLNTGYDSRPFISGDADTGVSVCNKRTLSQHLPFNAKAVSNSCNFNAYALVPIGDTEQRINIVYQGQSLDTYRLDVCYLISPQVHASVGYY